MDVALVPVPGWQKVVNQRTQATNDENTPMQWHTRVTMNQAAKREGEVVLLKSGRSRHGNLIKGENVRSLTQIGKKFWFQNALPGAEDK